MQIETSLDRLQDFRKLGRLQQRRRAPSEEETVNGVTLWNGAGNRPYLPRQRVDIGRDESLLPCIGIEITIRAAMDTKGDVKIEGITHVINSRTMPQD